MAPLCLDPEVIRQPVHDGLLDLLRRELFGGGALCECGKFGVRGEAESDELGLGEGANLGELGGGEEGSQAKTLSRRMRRSCTLRAEVRATRARMMRATDMTIHQRKSSRCCGQWWMVA